MAEYSASNGIRTVIIKAESHTDAVHEAMLANADIKTVCKIEDDPADIDVHPTRESLPNKYWKFCGEDFGYGLFDNQHPMDVAKRVIREVFTEEEIRQRRFLYKVSRYRGMNNLQDRIYIYCNIKQNIQQL